MAEVAVQEIKVSPTSRGLAVIITNDYIGANHTDLKGTHSDGERMKEAFEALKFDVYWKKNVNQNDIQRLWGEISSFSFESVRHYECMVFVFSGHGEPEGHDGKLIMQDDTKIDICADFIAPVLPGNAKMIGDIPKIFFIDACRGDEATGTVDVPIRDGGATRKGSPSNAISRKGCYKIDLQKIPTEGSCLIAYSTLPGCKSNEYNGDFKGSLWLNFLAKQLQVSDASIEDLLTDVNEELLAHCRKHNLEIQQPEKLARLNKRLHMLKRGCGDHGRRRISSEPMETDQPLTTGPTSVPPPPTEHAVPQDGSSVDPVVPQPVQAMVLVQGTPTRTSSSAVVSRPKGSGKYCAYLKEHVKPQFAYVTDRSSGSTRHRCTISYYKDGTKNYMDGGYCTTRISAEEQAAKRILKEENWLNF